ncbi:hypothetical protein ACFUTY_37300 [Streptomyces sp. NPDC057362]|uniref:hypothetical protein n=1 Tax=Streptomyces sp. NPDC057362 TaxID=3346106 RepID=UPI00362DCAE7
MNRRLERIVPLAVLSVLGGLAVMLGGALQLVRAHRSEQPRTVAWGGIALLGAGAALAYSSVWTLLLALVVVAVSIRVEQSAR